MWNSVSQGVKLSFTRWWNSVSLGGETQFHTLHDFSPANHAGEKNSKLRKLQLNPWHSTALITYAHPRMLFKMRNCHYRLVVVSSLSSVCYNASITPSSYHLSSSSMIYAVNVYVPVQSSPGVRSALAQAKAGNFTTITHIALSVKGVVSLTALYCTYSSIVGMIGNYDSCSFTSMGTGR